MGVKIKLNAEQTKKFLGCFVDEARRVLTERKRAEQEAKESKEEKQDSA